MFNSNIPFPVSFLSEMTIILTLPIFSYVNVDGSFIDSSSMMGTGGLVRSTMGDWLGGFSSSEGKGDILLAELLAVKHGIMLAWHKGFKNVILESDSMDLVNLMNDRRFGQFHVYATLVGEIKRLLQCDWIMKIMHVYRDANICADTLAKHGNLHCDGMKTWE